MKQALRMRPTKISGKRQPSLPGIKEPLREFGGGLLKNSHAKVKRPIACRRPMHVVLRSSRSRGARSLLSPRRAGRIQGILHIQAERFRVKLMKIANAGNHLHLVVKAQTVEGFKGFLRAVAGAIAKFCRGLEAREMNAIEARERRTGGVVVRGMDVAMGAKNPGAIRKAEGGVIAANTKTAGHDYGSDGQNAQKAEAKNLKAADHEPASDGRKRWESNRQNQLAAETVSKQPETQPNKKEKFWDQRPFTKILEWGRMHRAALKYLTQNMLEAIGFIPYQERRQNKVLMDNQKRLRGRRQKLKTKLFETIST